jgi:hypothetical protein
MEQNNAAVEIQRRQAIVTAQANAGDAQAKHRANVPLTEKARSPAAHPSRMRLAQYDRQDWIVNAEPGHTLADVLRPSYWAHMAQQMNHYDHIEVRAEEGTWVAGLLVVQVDRTFAKVVLLWEKNLESTETVDGDPGHVVEWKGPQRKFAVIRMSDRELIRDGFKNRDEANAWLIEHERVISG